MIKFRLYLLSLGFYLSIIFTVSAATLNEVLQDFSLNLNNLSNVTEVEPNDEEPVPPPQEAPLFNPGDLSKVELQLNNPLIPGATVIKFTPEIQKIRAKQLKILEELYKANKINKPSPVVLPSNQTPLAVIRWILNHVYDLAFSYNLLRNKDNKKAANEIFTDFKTEIEKIVEALIQEKTAVDNSEQLNELLKNYDLFVRAAKERNRAKCWKIGLPILKLVETLEQATPVRSVAQEIEETLDGMAEIAQGYKGAGKNEQKATNTVIRQSTKEIKVLVNDLVEKKTPAANALKLRKIIVKSLGIFVGGLKQEEPGIIQQVRKVLSKTIEELEALPNK